jgi:hypothetical protein
VGKRKNTVKVERTERGGEREDREEKERRGLVK